MEVAGTCIRCKGECSQRTHVCDHCLIDLWCEAERQIRESLIEQAAETIEVFRSELNESTEKIWERINR